MRLDNPAVTAAPPLTIVAPYQSGRYYWLPPSTTSAALTPSKEVERAVAFYVPNAVTLTRLGITVQAAGDAGSVIRLGLRNDDGTGRPGTLLLDAGTVPGDATGNPEKTISQALLANTLYWATMTTQIVTVTAPTIFCVGGGSVAMGDQGTSAPSAGANTFGRGMTGVTGALPNAWTDAGVTPTVARAFGKIA